MVFFILGGKTKIKGFAGQYRIRSKKYRMKQYLKKMDEKYTSPAVVIYSDKSLIIKKEQIQIKKWNKKNYSEYLQSNHWKSIKVRYWERFKKECYICGNRKELQLHHKTYKRIGKEKLSDLELLCGKCHKRVHDILNGKVYFYHPKKLNLLTITKKLKRGRPSSFVNKKRDNKLKRTRKIQPKLISINKQIQEINDRFNYVMSK